jgi:WD40 repeat protein
VLAAQPRNGALEVYDLRAGTLIGKFWSDEFALSLSFTPDGDLLVGMGSGRLVVVDVSRLGRSDDGAEAVRWTAAAHAGSLQATSASVDGLIATGSTAGNIRLWSADGELLADLALPPDVTPATAFSPDGRALYYASIGGVIRRFVLDPDEREALARTVLTRWFTPDECARYFPDQACPESPLTR